MQKLVKADPLSYQLETAQLSWDQNNVPIASNYDDIYYSREHGLDESRYVFLQHNQLAKRWKNLKKNQLFTIAETGFGTGLNFLASWQLWQETATPTSRLLFISAEKHPFKQGDLQRALAPWHELTPYSEQLIKHYPCLTPGSHMLHFDEGRVSLLLLLGDAEEGFEQLLSNTHPQWRHTSPYNIDAWFLDGFTPDRNPQLWQPALYRLMASLSSTTTTLSTFTAASNVRRGLEAEGFSINKAKGYGQKREMLIGSFPGLKASSEKPLQPHSHAQENRTTRTHTNKAPSNTPWYLSNQKPVDGKHIAIIGAGLAGCSSAYAMARRGWKVSLIERQPTLASGASGNPQGMLYTKLSPLAATLNQFTLSSYLYALNFYQQQGLQNHGEFCGVLQLANTSKELQLMAQLKTVFSCHPKLVQFVNPEQASEIAGVRITSSGWLFPAAGWLSPPRICQSLSQHPNIEIYRHQPVLTLSHDDKQWTLAGQEQFLLQADAVIIANSNDALQFQQSAQLPLKSIRGQITQLDKTKVCGQLKTVICHEGYITPAIEGYHSLGATYDNNSLDLKPLSADHLRNLQSLHHALPSLLSETPAALCNNEILGRASLRCASPDYLPIVGPVPIRQQFISDYAPLKKNANYSIAKAGSYYPGLFINVAHGSRGLTSTPLCSELLASIVCNEPPPVPRKLLKSLNPGRFIIRDLIRNKL